MYNYRERATTVGERERERARDGVNCACVYGCLCALSGGTVMTGSGARNTVFHAHRLGSTSIGPCERRRPRATLLHERANGEKRERDHGRAKGERGRSYREPVGGGGGGGGCVFVL